MFTFGWINFRKREKKMFFQCKTQGIGFSRTTNKTLFLLSAEHKKENKNFIHCVGNHLFAEGAGKIVLSAQKSRREEILVIFLFVSCLKPSWESFPARACLFYMWKRLEGRIWNYTNVVCCLLRFQVNVIRNENSEATFQLLKKKRKDLFLIATRSRVFSLKCRKLENGNLEFLKSTAVKKLENSRK